MVKFSLLLAQIGVIFTLNEFDVVESMSRVHVPVGNDGDGLYSAATKGCFDVIQAASPLVLDEISKQYPQQRSTGSNAYHIADYGTADAGTSLGLLSKMVKQIRRISGVEDKEVVLHYEDQLTNEWKSVFNHVLGNIEVRDAYGNLVESPMGLGNVFVEACGVTFHKQCYPSESIDFGVSFTAMHWLSTSPASLKGTPAMHAVRCLSPAVEERDQAAHDWSCILEARSKELVKGGRFVCVNFCCSEEGYFLGQTDSGVSMWDSFEASWNKLKEQGLIDEDERLGVSFPSYYRKNSELLEGIANVPSLRVSSIAEKIVRCPYRELWRSGKTGMTARQYAEWFVPTTRTWSHSTFKEALREGREDKEEVLEQFWGNYMDLVELDPSSHGMDYVHNYIVLEKL